MPQMTGGLAPDGLVIWNVSPAVQEPALATRLLGFEITKLSKSSLRVKDQVEICVVRIYWIKASFCLKVENVIWLDLSKSRIKFESYRFKETSKNLIIYSTQPISDFETSSQVIKCNLTHRIPDLANVWKKKNRYR
jgi:hypothetical protein